MKLKADETFKHKLYQAASEIAGALSVPIDIDYICHQFGVSIRRSGDQKRKAFLKYAPEGYQIILSASNEQIGNYTKFQRFLIAHELGHFILKRDLSAAPLGNSEYWRHEALCDYFARLLLLPENYVRALLRETKASLSNLLKLSNALSIQAQVTWITAAYRITDIIPEFVFLELHIRKQIKGPPYFYINASTIPTKKVQRGKVFVNSGLGKLLSPLMADSLFLEFDGIDLKEPETLKKYPALSEVKAGMAVRYYDRVQLALQLHDKANNSNKGRLFFEG